MSTAFRYRGKIWGLNLFVRCLADLLLYWKWYTICHDWIAWYHRWEENIRIKLFFPSWRILKVDYIWLIKLVPLIMLGKRKDGLHCISTGLSNTTPIKSQISIFHSFFILKLLLQPNFLNWYLMIDQHESVPPKFKLFNKSLCIARISQIHMIHWINH